MTRREINVYLAAIITTIADMPEGAPSGHLYAGLMGQMDLSSYQLLIGVCKDAGLIAESNHLITLTDKGREVVVKLKAMCPGA